MSDSISKDIIVIRAALKKQNSTVEEHRDAECLRKAGMTLRSETYRNDVCSVWTFVLSTSSVVLTCCHNALAGRGQALSMTQ